MAEDAYSGDRGSQQWLWLYRLPCQSEASEVVVCMLLLSAPFPLSPRIQIEAPAQHSLADLSYREAG